MVQLNDKTITSAAQRAEIRSNFLGALPEFSLAVDLWLQIENTPVGMLWAHLVYLRFSFCDVCRALIQQSCLGRAGRIGFSPLHAPPMQRGFGET